MKKSSLTFAICLGVFALSCLSSCSSNRRTCNGRGGWYKNRNVQIHTPADQQQVQQIAFAEEV